MTESVTVRRVDAGEAMTCVDVLIDCVEGGASVGFMSPIERPAAVAFRANVANVVANGERILLVAEHAAGRIVCTLQVVTAQPENQPHRADISKMRVSRRARRQGIAERLYEPAGWRRAERCGEA
jgi:ribosomal protein S18 acetylase RimI-like enzyme